MERERGGRPRYPGVLTPAEQRVLEELRNGGSNAEIAARLGISRETVKTHIASMLSKLDLADRHELAAWRPEPPRRGARGWLGLLVRPAFGLGAATGVGAVIVIFAVVMSASRDDAESIDIPLAETAFEVMSCSSGIAVTNPDANPELVADCEALLGLRDTLRGTGTLNWTAGKPMSEWMGVTVSGTPQRVTGLNLADVGLDGQLSGLLGNLTGLTELDLSGNALTGMLPSKLGRLTALTNVSLSGTDLEGCAPPVLRQAATNDVSGTGLDDCGPPAKLPSGGAVIPPGTYRYADVSAAYTGLRPIVFDVPAGLSLRYDGTVVVQHARGSFGGKYGLALTDTVTDALLNINLTHENEGGRSLDWLDDEATEQRLNKLFDLILESTWFIEE